MASATSRARPASVDGLPCSCQLAFDRGLYPSKRADGLRTSSKVAVLGRAPIQTDERRRSIEAPNPEHARYGFDGHPPAVRGGAGPSGNRGRSHIRFSVETGPAKGLSDGDARRGCGARTHSGSRADHPVARQHAETESPQVTYQLPLPPGSQLTEAGLGLRAARDPHATAIEVKVVDADVDELGAPCGCLASAQAAG